MMISHPKMANQPPEPSSPLGETQRFIMQANIVQYSIDWGTLALITAGLAQSKNRSGLAWFFASWFLGPIATLAVVIVDKAKDS